jgi:septum formation protein
MFENSPEEFTVIGSDTAVFLDNIFLGKPKDKTEAERMLKKLSGRWHTVYTSAAVIYGKGTKRVSKVKLFSTRVKFARLTPRALEWYLSTGEPFDKAGAYGIQGFGAIFIEKLVGDYFTVMGLPARGLFELLSDLLGEEKVFKILSTEG